jgi:SAM-dependent methyltransferase
MRMYDELAAWFPLLSHPDDYEEEAVWIRPRLGEGVRSVLELGAGGGHTAHHLGADLELVLTDVSEGMLAASRALNPGREHVLGDMRGLRLERRFDAVLLHDAVMYMLTEGDLLAAFETARGHLRPGGRFVVLPDCVAETFSPSTSSGGHDAPDGRGVRYLEWTVAGPRGAGFCDVHYTILVRHADGRVESFYDLHREGIFPRARWLALLAEAGFEARVEVDPWHRDVFIATLR